MTIHYAGRNLYECIHLATHLYRVIAKLIDHNVQLKVTVLKFFVIKRRVYIVHRVLL